MEFLDEFEGIKLRSGKANTGLPPQMSDGWVQYVANRLLEDEDTLLIGRKLIEYLRYEINKISKFISAVDRVNNQIIFVKLDNY